MSIDALQTELSELERKLADPEFVLDYKRVAEASKRYAEIQRTIEAIKSGVSTAEFSEVLV